MLDQCTSQLQTKTESTNAFSRIGFSRKEPEAVWRKRNFLLFRQLLKFRLNCNYCDCEKLQKDKKNVANSLVVIITMRYHNSNSASEIVVAIVIALQLL